MAVSAPFHTANADDPKPDFALKSKAVEITVTLDADLKANQPLAENLLAEGKRWAQKYLADANKELKESPERFSEGRTWSLDRNYEMRSVVAGHYVSVGRSDYTETGGAHPNTDINTIIWDNTTRKRISIRPFFRETADDGPTLKAILEAIVVSLRAEKKERDTYTSDADIRHYLEPKLLKIGAVTFEPSTEAGKSSGLSFDYPAYAVGAYVEGPYDAFVPWDVLKPYLSAEGIAVFGGTRPAETSQSEK
ncbi:hypothetical protein [Bradyrhizobium sp. SYSU BS000235]|uniref:hypothetical protein n=1 Tax=Bradyrhizobium sp. SYSU BS000235 TaxID=3411332 RepID=UPI003C71776D